MARYLGLDQPLRSIERELGHDPVLARILPLTSGIAILRQDPWECLASFIISAFNNIPKIELTIARLSERFGDALPGGGRAFPQPAALADAAARALAAAGPRAGRPPRRGLGGPAPSGTVRPTYARSRGSSRRDPLISRRRLR